MTFLPLKNIAKDSLVAFTAKVLTMIVGFATNLALARIYGPELMGSFFIAVNLVVIFSTVCRMGLDNGLLRFAAILKGEGRTESLQKLIWPALGVTLLLSGAVAAFIFMNSVWLAEYFQAPALPSMLAFFAISLPIYVGVSLFQETVRGLGAVKWAALGQYTVIPFSLLTLILIFGYFGHEEVAKSRILGLAFLGSTILGSAFLGLRILSLLRGRSDGAPSESFSGLLLYSWPLYANAVLLLAISSCDSLILGLFTSPQEVAFYGAAVKTAALVTFPLLAINAVVPPLFSQFYQQQDLNSLENVAQTTARWMYLLALPIALLIILLGPELLAFFGPDFATAQLALTLLALGQLVNVAAGSVGYILIMTAHQHVLLRLQMVVAGAILPIMFLAAATWGLNGVAAAMAIGNSVINLFMARVVWRHLHIKAFIQGGGWITVSGFLASLLFLLSKPFGGSVIATLAFIICYLFLLYETLHKELNSIISIKPAWIRGDFRP